MTESTAQPQAEPGQRARGIAPGDLVITFYDDKPMLYGGNEDGPFTTLSFKALGGGTPERKCDPGQVAPASTPIPAADPRVSVAKRRRDEAPQPGYIWALSLPGAERPTWHKTKRHAVATSLRRLAILDWHAARAAEADTGAGPQSGTGT
jgi:hypothetical protein